MPEFHTRRIAALVAAIIITAIVLAAGIWQNENLASGDTTPPEQVRGLGVEAIGGGRLLLDWDPAVDDRGISHYLIYRDGLELEDWPALTHHIDDGLQPGLVYTYRVRAVDTSGNEGPLSDPVSGTP